MAKTSDEKNNEVESKTILSRPERDQEVREGYRRPSAKEYSQIRLAGLARLEKLLGLLRDIDAKLDDASKQFDRYQKRTHGSIAISFRQVDKSIYPSVVVFYFNNHNRSFAALTMKDADVDAWNLGKWSKANLNPGLPFKVAFREVWELIMIRREIMAGLSGRPSRLGLSALETKTRAALNRMDKKLDALVQAMVYDWDKKSEIRK